MFAMMISSKTTSTYWTIEDMLGLADTGMKSLMVKYFPFTMPDHKFCDLDGIKACKAPNCSICSHYSDCFGPEIAAQRAA